MTNSPLVFHVIKIAGIAGAENHLLTLLPGLRENGFDARFLALVKPGAVVDDFMDAAATRHIPVERLPIRADADPILLLSLRRHFRASRPAIVHTHLIHADLHGISAARLAGVPVVLTSRHNDDTFRRKTPYRQINRALWHMAQGGIAISEAIRRFSIAVEGAPPDRVQTIHYGLSPTPLLDRADSRRALQSELNLAPETLLIGMVCRLIEPKGIPYALDAFAGVAGHFPTAHLVIAGDGPLRPDLEAQTASLGLEGRVHFLGWRPDPTPIFAALDCFLMPSLREGFGLVLLEAMAQAVPVIGSAVSAIPEIVVAGETGLLCPVRDSEALAAALTALLADSERRTRMGEAGRARLEAHFSAARMIEETVALYRRWLPHG